MALAAALGLGATPAAAEPNPWWAGYETAPLVKLPDGRAMRIYCMGQGAPVVILDAGLGDGAWTWRKVQGEMAKTTRVCSYDRAGYGGSEPGPGLRDIDAEQADLAALLKAAHLKGPYVLVGHSLGGEIIRQFAYRHPRDVAGLVMVDTANEHQNARFEAVKPGFLKTQALPYAAFRTCAEKLEQGPIAPDAPEARICLNPPPSDMAPDLVHFHIAYRQTPGHFRVMVSEFEALDSGADDREADQARHSLGDVPLIVLTGADTSKQPVFSPGEQQAIGALWWDLHDQVAHLSSRGQNRLIDGAGHYIQNDRPQAVIDAVNEVVAQVRARRSGK
jgi:pimeloyl-ACP methyl ester carboxylesterase